MGLASTMPYLALGRAHRSSHGKKDTHMGRQMAVSLLKNCVAHLLQFTTSSKSSPKKIMLE